MEKNIYDVAIIGSGPAGLTAGLYAHRSGMETIILGGDSPGGKVMMHPQLENYPPFPGGVTGTELMIRWIKQVSDELGEGPLPVPVTSVDFSTKPKKINTDSGEYKARAVIVATGASPKMLGVPGEEKLMGKGVFSCAMCDAPLLRTLPRSRAMVVGGGDTAVQTAIALLPHAESVTLLTRGSCLRAQTVLSNRFEKDNKSKTICEKNVTSLEGGDWIRGALLTDENGNSEFVELEAVFIGIGQVPNTAFLGGDLELDPEGFIITDEILRTSKPGVFAAGDVRVSPLRQIVTASSDGALAAKGASEFAAAER